MRFFSALLPLALLVIAPARGQSDPDPPAPATQSYTAFVTLVNPTPTCTITSTQDLDMGTHKIPFPCTPFSDYTSCPEIASSDEAQVVVTGTNVQRISLTLNDLTYSRNAPDVVIPPRFPRDEYDFTGLLTGPRPASSTSLRFKARIHGCGGALYSGLSCTQAFTGTSFTVEANLRVKIERGVYNVRDTPPGVYRGSFGVTASCTE